VFVCFVVKSLRIPYCPLSTLCLCMCVHVHVRVCVASCNMRRLQVSLLPYLCMNVLCVRACVCMCVCVCDVDKERESVCVVAILKLRFPLSFV